MSDVVWRFVHIAAFAFNASFVGVILFRIFADGNLTLEARPVAEPVSAATTLFMVLWGVVSIASIVRGLFNEEPK